MAENSACTSAAPMDEHWVASMAAHSAAMRAAKTGARWAGPRGDPTAELTALHSADSKGTRMAVTMEKTKAAQKETHLVGEMAERLAARTG